LAETHLIRSLERVIPPEAGVERLRLEKLEQPIQVLQATLDRGSAHTPSRIELEYVAGCIEADTGVFKAKHYQH
jgi:hypothetical protein